MQPAITVENLGKKYRIFHAQERGKYKTLRESLMGAAAGPIRRLRGAFATQHSTLSTQHSTEDFWALKDVSFDVQPGEVVGIIGRNGAGKSTLLKILSRITKPTTGHVKLRGRFGSLLEVGTGFHPELTGRENVYLNGSILGMKRGEIRRQFDEIVAFAEVERFLDTPVKRYSSGMYVRLAFAVAAHLDPELLMVDEVLAVGDAAFQEKCMGQMKRTASEGRTILLVSHNLASIQQLCTRVVWVRRGEVAADGAPREVARAYMSESTQERNNSVREWQDRESNGRARIVNLQVVDARNGRRGSIEFGSDLRLAIEVEFNEPALDPGFGVFIHTMEGEPLLDVRSSHSGVRLGRVDGRVTMEVTVARVGLHPGEYLLSPWISDARCTVDLDWAKHCSTLQVDPAPMGRAVKLNPEYGKYWVPSAWKLT